jgi:hypothetical protein
MRNRAIAKNTPPPLLRRKIAAWNVFSQCGVARRLWKCASVDLDSAHKLRSALVFTLALVAVPSPRSRERCQHLKETITIGNTAGCSKGSFKRSNGNSRIRFPPTMLSRHHLVHSIRDPEDVFVNV